MQTFISILVVAVVLGLVSCSQMADENTKFETLANQYIDQYLKFNPEQATALGDHRYDHMLYDYSPVGMVEELSFQRTYRESLKAIDITRLSDTNRIDLKIMQNAIEAAIFELETLRSHEWDPLVYVPGHAIYSLLAREFAPLTGRLKNVKARLMAIPALLEQAKANLNNPPKIHVETAILQNAGTIGLIRDELNIFLKDAPGMQEEFRPIQKRVVEELENYGVWLKEELLPNANGDFRIGDEKFRKKLRHTLDSELTLEEILASAEADLAESQQTMYEVAVPMYRDYYPKDSGAAALADKKQVIRKVLNRLSEERPNADNIVDLAREYLKECNEFVIAEKLATMPTEPLQIIVMPEYQRGVAVAYCDSPGPLDENAKTFYSISPPPENWDEQRVESFFREYNNYMLRNLTVHEAMPGHYLQLAHSNKFKAPTMLRSIFMSGTFIEGWATYSEQLMVERGYGGPEVQMQQLKMRLRLIINAIIDQKIHTAGMTEQEAMNLMVNEGFQEDGEAAGKWRRACMSSTQLSTYYIGNIEINGLRKAYEAANGGEINMQIFHDTAMSFGSPAAKYVSEMMGLQ